MDFSTSDRPNWGSDAMEVFPTEPTFAPSVPGRQYETSRSTLAPIATAKQVLVTLTTPVANTNIKFNTALKGLIGFKIVGLHHGDFVNPGTDSLIQIRSSRLSSLMLGDRSVTGASTGLSISDVIGTCAVAGNTVSSHEEHCISYWFRRPETLDFFDVSISLLPSGAQLPGGKSIVLNLIFYTLPNPG